MALTFPLTLADFANTLWIQQEAFDLGESQSFGETGGGEIIGTSQGKRLWGGSVSVTPRYHADQARVEAVLRALRTPGGTFNIGDMARRFPTADPDGTILGANTVAIDSVSTDRTEITFTGLPNGYVLTPGDYFHFTYDGRRAFHQIVDGATAASGEATVQVVPAIRPYSSAGNVTFKNPALRAVVIPGTTQMGARGPLFTDGFTFEFRQTLRG